MKFKYQVLIGLTSILFSTTSFAEKLGIPCSGVSGSYHTNPDSSLGGYVASTALVDSTVMIGPDASVCGRATVIEEANIFDRAEVSGTAIVRGLVVQSGRVNRGEDTEINGDAIPSNASTYLYFTIGSIGNGGCLEYKIKHSLGQLKSNKNVWKYRKMQRGEYELEYL